MSKVTGGISDKIGEQGNWTDYPGTLTITMIMMNTMLFFINTEEVGWFDDDVDILNVVLKARAKK